MEENDNFNLYKFVKNIDSKSLFKYIALTIFFVIIFRRFDITLSIVFAIIFSICIVFYKQQEKTIKNDDDKKQHKIKLKTIKPTPKNFDKYKDIVSFFFSIQDFYIYNPQAYEEVIENVDSFFKIYEDINNAPELSNDYFELSENKKKSALNALHSLIFKIPTSIIAIKKLNKSIVVLEKILNNYLDNLILIHKNHLYAKGYNTNYKIINTFPKAHNYYNKNKYSYELY